MIHLSKEQITDLLTLADRVGECIMTFYNSGFDVTLKSDNSPVTQADIAASELLEKALRKIAPYPVLSEENTPNNAEWLTWETYWLIDPIDGTKHFINRSGEFCVCIALIHQHQAVFGLITMPTTQTTWYAQHDGKGVFKAVNGQTQSLITLAETVPLTVVLSATHLSDNMATLLRFLPDYSWYRRGSALKYIALVEGEAALYPKMWDTCEWDSAAGQCLVECAGGAVIRLDNGQPLRYGRSANLLNPHFIAYRHLNPQQVTDLLQQYQTLTYG